MPARGAADIRHFLTAPHERHAQPAKPGSNADLPKATLTDLALSGGGGVTPPRFSPGMASAPPPPGAKSGPDLWYVGAIINVVRKWCIHFACTPLCVCVWPALGSTDAAPSPPPATRLSPFQIGSIAINLGTVGRAVSRSRRFHGHAHMPRPCARRLTHTGGTAHHLPL